MESAIFQLKQSIRRQIKGRIKSMSDSQRELGSVQACQLLRGQVCWRESRTVLLFAPLAGELDVWPLVGIALAEGKSVALPRFDATAQVYRAVRIEDASTDIILGRYGIREPIADCCEIPLNRLDFLLAPGIGFDLRGRRLGRGKGFYDQMLASARGLTCGVAFDEQIADEVPVEPHDVPVNCILTPTRWLEL